MWFWRNNDVITASRVCYVYSAFLSHLCTDLLTRRINLLSSHFSTFKWSGLVKLSPGIHSQYHSQYHGGWWLGDARSQCIRRLVIALICPTYSLFHTMVGQSINQQLDMHANLTKLGRARDKIHNSTFVHKRMVYLGIETYSFHFIDWAWLICHWTSE